MGNHEEHSEELKFRLAQAEYERDMLRALINHAPFYAYIRDVNHRFVFSNKKHSEKLGVASPEQIVGKPVTDFFQKADEASFIADESDMLKQNRTHESEGWSNLADGRRFWHVTSKYPVYDADGKPMGIVGITVDATDEKRKQEVIEAQQEVLRKVGTPIIPVTDGVVILPLIGEIDSQRAVEIMRAVLAGITKHQADVIIIDITGVPLVDTGIAAHFNRTIQAVKLKGARAILTGITENVAETIVDLGIDWSDIETLPDLQSGLRLALNRQNKMED